MKILFLNPFPYGMAAGQRLKYEQYLSYFEESGHILDHHYFMSPWLYRNKLRSELGKKILVVLMTMWLSLLRWTTLFKVQKYDIVYIFMWGTPVGLPIYEWCLVKLSRRLIYDMEDAIHTKPGLLGVSAKARFLLENADTNIVSSHFLQEKIRGINKKTHYISSSVNLDIWQPNQTLRENISPLVIGWTGTLSSGKYLLELMPKLINVCRDNNAKLLIIGDFVLEEFVDCNVVEFRKWSLQNEQKDLQEIDVGIYPLPSEAWVFGKSGLKLIQYLALGIPQVSSNVGMNPLLIDDGKQGFLANTVDEFCDSVTKLLSNAKLRQKMGEKARELAEKKFASQIIRETYLKVLEDRV